MSRRKFTASFKLNAIKLGEEKQNVAQAARELGVKASLIHRWKREQQEFSHNSFPGYGRVKMTDEQREIAKLKKDLREAKMETELEKRGFKVSRPRAARMMRASSLQARRKRKFKCTTDSNHNYPIAPNRLNRNFTTERHNAVWVSDITYIETSQGWLYLTVIIDLFDRKVIGWAMSEDMTAESTVIKAWHMAVGNRPIKQELIFHSDRGSQYACTKFRNILKSYNFVQQSMSRKGNCWDNAVAESFFKSLKTEWVYKNEYLRKTDAEMSIFKWIETWYNRNRRHSALNYKTIKEFELEIINHKYAA